MRGKIFRVALLLAALGCLAASFAEAQNTPSPPAPPPATLTPAAPAASPTATPAASPSPTPMRSALNLPSGRASVDRARAMDAGFMTRAQKRGLELAELGTIAAARASDPQVRSLGQQVLEDRGRANAALRLLAQGEAISLPAALDAGRRDELERISRLSSPALDRTLVLAMLRLHDADVADFQKQTQAGQEVELQGWVYDTLPQLEDQQEEIHRIAGELGIPVPAVPAALSR